MTTKLSIEEKEQRKLLFGKLRDGLKPLHPYRWGIEGVSNGIIEIPVTTMPVFKIPFHLSYIIYISHVSPILARHYFRLALSLCKITRTAPSLLLHPLDFLGCDDLKELSFFPAMNVPSKEKLKLVSEVLKIYSDRFTIVPLREYAHVIDQENQLQIIEPKFGSIQTAIETPQS